MCINHKVTKARRKEAGEPHVQRVPSRTGFRAASPLPCECIVVYGFRCLYWQTLKVFETLRVSLWQDSKLLAEPKCSHSQPNCISTSTSNQAWEISRVYFFLMECRAIFPIVSILATMNPRNDMY